MKIRDRIRGFTRLAPERIRPNPKNWRTHPDRQRDALQGVLADVGIADAVLVVPCDADALASLVAAKDFDKWLKGYDGDFLLVDGHLRAETITGQPVPALVLDLDEREQAEVLVTFDPVGDLAGADREALIALAGEFNSTNAAVQALVSDLADFGVLPGIGGGEGGAAGEDDEEDDGGAAERAAAKAALAAGLAEADDGPLVNPTDALREKWGTAKGQLWVIPSLTTPGQEHRLLCGDSTKADDVARLMDGRQAVIMQTDAPYGVDYSKTKNGIPDSGFTNHTERWGDIENDELTGNELKEFVEGTIRASLPHLRSDVALYFWHPGMRQGESFAAAFAACDIVVHRQIIWVKRQMVLTRSGMYHWKHELCSYGWLRGNKPPWRGDKGQTSVWEIGRDDDAGMHPTQKPVALWIPPLNNHTVPGEVAYEPFSGSGGQLLACEQLGRVCCAMELEPKYVAVALERALKRGLTPRLAA